MMVVLAVAVGLLGVLGVVAGGLAIFVGAAARRAFEAAMADPSDDGLRARGVLLVERVRNPALRWVINRRTGAMAGAVAAGIVRDRLDAMRRGGLVAIAVSVALVIAAFFIPGLAG